MERGAPVMVKETGDWVCVEFSHFNRFGDLVDVNGTCWRRWIRKELYAELSKSNGSQKE